MDMTPVEAVIRRMQKRGPVFSFARQVGDGFQLTLLTGDYTDEGMEKAIREQLAVDGVEVGEVLKRDKQPNGTMTRLVFDAPDGVEVVAYRREPDAD